jgi:hypothetical protein
MLVFWILYWVITALWAIWMVGYPVLHVKIRKEKMQTFRYVFVGSVATIIINILNLLINHTTH